MAATTIDAPVTLGYALGAFLRAELDSPTESDRLHATLDRLGFDARNLAPGAVSDDTLHSLFMAYRGHETLFESLDLRDLEWSLSSLSLVDLKGRVRTCRNHFEDRYGTRDPVRVAERWDAAGRSNGLIRRVAEGDVFEPPILVGIGENSPLVILEGHNRLISYLRDPNQAGFPVPVVIGTSARVATWSQW